LAEVTSELIKELRESTGAGLLDCKKALVENDGDIAKAVTYLREKGMAKAAKRVDKETKEGRVISYIHSNGKIGVLLELNCETDFVAKNEGYDELGKEICLQIAATNPLYLDIANVPEVVIAEESRILKTQLLEQGKKEDQIEKILPGKLTSYYKENCLLEQEFIKDAKKTVKDFILECSGRFGEKITIGKYIRYQIGA
jgi:elongation factor Ts